MVYSLPTDLYDPVPQTGLNHPRWFSHKSNFSDLSWICLSLALLESRHPAFSPADSGLSMFQTVLLAGTGRRSFGQESQTPPSGAGPNLERSGDVEIRLEGPTMIEKLNTRLRLKPSPKVKLLLFLQEGANQQLHSYQPWTENAQRAVLRVWAFIPSKSLYQQVLSEGQVVVRFLSVVESLSRLATFNISQNNSYIGWEFTASESKY